LDISKKSTIERTLNVFLNNGIQSLLADGKIGIEREALRVNSNGSIATTPHPKELGSPLTHPNITTDYSEALIELITPAFTSIDETYVFLNKLHQYVYRNLDNEILWMSSMPCIVNKKTGVPVAQYGDSNAGTMKKIYRRGLGLRYGRTMQAIAGVHFNYSFSKSFWENLHAVQGDAMPIQEFISNNYFCLIRNLLRFGWLITYLFGSSPAVCKSFLHGEETNMESFDPQTFFEKHATSLRMGDIGYQNNKEAEIGVEADYNDVKSYAKSLLNAVQTPCPEYEKIGVKVDGEYRQLSSNILQVENEYYGAVRAKPKLTGNEMPSLALLEKGVHYVELRSLDINVFDPLGIETGQLYFLEALMIYCLLKESPLINDHEKREINYNETKTAHHGRMPQLCLQRGNKEISLKEYAINILTEMQDICAVLDTSRGVNQYSLSLNNAMDKVKDPSLTPSAKIIQGMRQDKLSFFEYTWDLSNHQQEYFFSLPEDKEFSSYLDSISQDSVFKQREIEQKDNQKFDEYLHDYFNQINTRSL